MEVAVWDTYVLRNDGRTMHFDVIVPAELTDAEKIYGFAREFVRGKGLEVLSLSSRECRFCHVEKASAVWEQTILQEGYVIYEMENCN